MDKIDFKKLLFKVAFCTMACDGHIDDREIEEMKLMDKNTSFFSDIDLAEELSLLINELENIGAKVIVELFSELRNIKLNPIQELLVLEVALRIIKADDKHDDNELKFINILRAKLEVHDETIIDRFGEVDILYTNKYSKNIVTEKHDSAFVESITLPDLPALKKVNFNTDNS